MAKARIMIVEDEAVTAMDLEMTLKEIGYEVVATASIGEEAIRKAEEQRPDLVLMDIVLQGEMDGIAAAEEMRKRFDIPVVYLTAYADEEKLSRARATEPFGYIVKPFNNKALSGNIEMALYKHDIEKKLKEHTDLIEQLNKQLVKGVLRMDELRKENERLKKEIEELGVSKG